MSIRRLSWPRRGTSLLLAFLVLLIIYYWNQMGLKLNFEPDAYFLDPVLGQYIRSKFPLPQKASPTVKMVHFMHKSYLVLPDHRRFLSSWRQVYPSYDLYFWTDADIERLVTTRYPELRNFYKKRLGNPLERSDVARVLILHAFGGWYADLDAGSQLNAENITERHSLIVPLEPFLHAMIPFNRRRLVNNAIMYSTPGHPFWMFLISRIAHRIFALPNTPRKKISAVENTGPLIMTPAMEQFAAAHAASCGDLRDGLGRVFGCPYVPLPRRFLPLIDNSSNWMASWAKIMCPFVFSEPQIIDECQWRRSTNFDNSLPSDSYTYHSFLHLTGEKVAATNISTFNLNIRFNPMNYLV
ncbi:hypothetical protein BOX15_Mlig023457g1 [Macrostomum lignano]|uniref:Uncharacterized protein n=1 Tax=Macrostomum lignano TaxID=282301 RepID=A0A267DUB8_9PLAT|nr:hypothetical protein BOX15_Mlig023457g1 [Macrostomum lignano]